MIQSIRFVGNTKCTLPKSRRPEFEAKAAAWVSFGGDFSESAVCWIGYV